MAGRTSLLQRVLILVVFVGVNGGLFGDHDSSTPSQEDPAATRFVTIMKKQIDKESYSKHKRNQKLPGDLSTNKQVQNFVFRKFKGEMMYMFSFLPKKKCCDILKSLSSTTKCNLTDVMYILRNESILKNPQQLDCSSKRTLPYSQCGSKDSVRVLYGFWNEMGKLFNNISVPFQCNIINRIATTSLRYRRQKQQDNVKIKPPRITLQIAEQQLEIIFPYLNIKEKCSKVWKPLKKLVPLQAPASLLNLTVKLDPGIKRKVWLRNFKRKAYQIYRIYYNHYYKSKKQRPLISKFKSPSNPPLLNNNNVKLTVARVTKAGNIVSVVFGVEVRKPRVHVFSRISPAKLVIVALKRLGTAALNTFFNATVVRLAGARQETSQVKYVLSMPQIMETKRQFPQYLVAYYRKLDRLGKCLVMLYISSSLNMNLRQVEMLYNTFKYVPRKYFCSSKRRILTSPVANRTHIYMESRANPVKSTLLPKLAKPKPAKPKPTTKGKILLRVKEKHTNTSNDIMDFPEESEEPDEKEITPLEIGLFAILALLCLAILAFTVNCVLFTIKKKKSPQPQQVNTAFAKAIFRKETNSTSTEDQHVKVIVNEELNTVDNSPRCCYLKDTPSASKQCTYNHINMREITLSKEEINVHSESNSMDSSSSRKDKLSEKDSLEDNQELSDDRTALSDDNNCSNQCNCSERTDSQSSIHDSRSNISLSDTSSHGPHHRTLKECIGELEVISDDDNAHVRSASCSSETSDPCLKNCTKKVVVHLDQSSDRETAT